MNIFPAIDLYGGKAVRLFKGDYEQMTVYSDNPVEIALDFERSGAHFMHLVDLEGAKTGETPNLETIKKLVSSTSLFVEVGGGIRSLAVIEKYIRNNGMDYRYELAEHPVPELRNRRCDNTNLGRVPEKVLEMV